MDMGELEATSFHTMIGCIIIPMNGGHPTVNSCERAIDHIVATRGVAELCSNAEALAEHAPSPHWPVRVEAGLGKTDMVTVLQKRRIAYAEPIVGPKANERQSLTWIRKQMLQLRHSIRDQGMHEWHQERLTYLHRRWETEVASQLAADCAQDMDCCAQIGLAWKKATELDRKPLGKRPQGASAMDPAQASRHDTN